MAGRRTKLGTRKLAILIAALGSPAKVAHKLKVSPRTIQRWRREGVPEARQAELSRVTGSGKKTRAPTPPPSPAAEEKPRNIKWRDEKGRWRNSSGSFTSTPHRPKDEAPRPRKHAPTPKPPKPRRRPAPPRIPKELLHPKPGSRFPRELLDKMGQVVGDAASGRLIVFPSSLEELAEKIKRPVSTLRKWIKDDRVPPDALANLHAVMRGARPHDEKYAHGRRGKWTRDEYKDLRAAAEAFKLAWEKDKASEVYAAWRAVKDRIRGSLTKKAWAKLMLKVGRKIGLADTGRFSSEMFRIS